MTWRLYCERCGRHFWGLFWRQGWYRCPHCGDDLAHVLDWPKLDRLFAGAFARHCRQGEHGARYGQPGGADYDVCRDPLCRAAWWLERWLWYEGGR